MTADAVARLAGRSVLVDHLYLHLPFCERRCPYCDFAVVVGRGADTDAFIAALEREADLWAGAGVRLGTSSPVDGTVARSTAAVSPPADDSTADGGSAVRTLYLGGGTPSWLSPADLERLLAWIGRTWGSEWTEATCEVNPEHADPERLAVLRSGGITRISLGAQSFSAPVLRRLGRVHTPADIDTAAGRITGAGFALSLDLIFGAPEQTRADWEADIERALALRPDHLSLYGLTWEEGTLFTRRRDRGRLTERDQEWLAAAYESAVAALRPAGHERYEVSNFARPVAEAVHNRAYWTGASWLGLGPSAHSHLAGLRIANQRELEAWQSSLLEGGRLPWAEVEEPDELARCRERVLLGLRTAAGLNLDRIPEVYREGILARSEATIARGLARREAERIVLTDAGMLLADELALRLAP